MRLIYRPISLFTRYKYPYNINKQENQQYLRKVQRAEQALQQNKKVNAIPRRKRRIYDRPRINDDIQGYGAWRVYQSDQWLYKIHDHCMQVMQKIQISPKWLIHAFGKGAIPVSNKRSSHRQFMFMDNQLNSYLLYQYRNTTDYKPNIEGYDYQNQQHLHPRERKSKRISPEEFWQSQNQFEFRINGTQYAQHFKFKKWIIHEIQKRKSLKNYDQYIDEKFGKPITFNSKQQMQHFKPHKPMILSVTPQHYNPKKGKTPEPPKQLTWIKLQQKYRIDKVEQKQESKTDS